MATIKLLLFDLDYTLYDMRQYLRGAFRDVAHAIAPDSDQPTEVLNASLWALWEEKGTDYGYLFNDWLTPLGLFTKTRLHRCIDVLHAHQPTLHFYPGVRAMLDTLRLSYQLGLITDGSARMQRHKIGALGAEAWFDPIIITADYGTSKPDSVVFHQALKRASVSPDETLYIGDRPSKDLVGAAEAGIASVRVLTGEFKGQPHLPAYPPTYTLPSVIELPNLLREVMVP